MLGTVYGGDGVTTFGLPDLRGRAPVHFASRTGQSGDTNTFTLGQKQGNVTATGTAQVAGAFTLTAAQLPAHTHPATATVTVATGGDASDNFAAGNLLGNTSGNTYTTAPSGTDKLGGTSATVTVGANTGGSPVTVQSTGTVSVAGQSPAIGMNYIIATTGVFPVRP